MSDTPRTESFNCYDNGCDNPLHAWGAFSAELERELNAANSKIELLMSANADVARIADERDAAEKRVRLLIAERDTAQLQASQNWKIREEFRALLGTDDVAKAVAEIRQMKERIERLEEALDKLFNLPNDCCCQLSDKSLDAWKNAHESLKAKEAKL